MLQEKVENNTYEGVLLKFKFNKILIKTLLFLFLIHYFTFLFILKEILKLEI